MKECLIINMYRMAASPMILASADYIKPITALKTILITIITAIGLVMLVWGGYEFATSYRKRDSSGQDEAAHKLVAAGIMLAIDTVIGLMM